jgi:Domain of unknown function (DUF4189)
VIITRIAAAAALSTAAVLSAPTANAADAYVVVSIGFINENPPVTTAGGVGVAPDENGAFTASLNNCVANGGNHCVAQASVLNGCAAAASNDFGEMSGATDPNLQNARNAAVAKLSNQQGAHVVSAGCAHRQVPPGMIENPPTAVLEPDAPPPPPEPTPVPCQPQPWCVNFPNLPNAPVLAPG